MESFDYFKNRINFLIGEMDKHKLKDVVRILELIKSDNLTIHSTDGSLRSCFTNIPLSLLNVAQNEDSIGFREDYLSHNMPNKVKIIDIIDPYIVENAEKFVKIPEGYILKDHSEVLMNRGKMVYKNFIFYSKYDGSFSTLYVNSVDYMNNMNGYSILTNKLFRLIPLCKLDKELEKYKKNYSNICQ